MNRDIPAATPQSAAEEPQTGSRTVYLALGSNIGDRRANLVAALRYLRASVEIDAISSLYETEPVGYLDQPRFFNLVCRGRTRLTPQELLKRAKEIEKALGRRPTFRNGPRPLDIDIILYDDLRIAQENLTIPHPRMAERAFVLAPLAEIAPDVRDPASGERARDLLAAVSQAGVKRLAEKVAITLEEANHSQSDT